MHILYKLLEIFDGHAISGMPIFIHATQETNIVSSYTYIIMYTCTYFSQTSSSKLTFSGVGVTELLQQSEQY